MRGSSGIDLSSPNTPNGRDKLGALPPDDWTRAVRRALTAHRDRGPWGHVLTVVAADPEQTDGESEEEVVSMAASSEQ